MAGSGAVSESLSAKMSIRLLSACFLLIMKGRVSAKMSISLLSACFYSPDAEKISAEISKISILAESHNIYPIKCSAGLP
ncbi:MAG: hypothetical protein PUE04_03630 [Lachnospira sp.]|nr:hypothetical protein [Lachnospira sp.]